MKDMMLEATRTVTGTMNQFGMALVAVICVAFFVAWINKK